MTTQLEVINEYKKQISFIQEQAQIMSITSQEELDKANEFLTVVMKVEKTLADRKAEITRPLMAGLASARELFKPLESDHSEAKKTIKQKMLDYTIAEQDRIDSLIEELEVDNKLGNRAYELRKALETGRSAKTESA